MNAWNRIHSYFPFVGAKQVQRTTMPAEGSDEQTKSRSALNRNDNLPIDTAQFWESCMRFDLAW